MQENFRENIGHLATGGGFVAGTQLWTDQGLKPIETIQVGDMVLSKPENGDGEQQYKRVVKTFVHEAKEILRLVLYVGEKKTKTIYPTGNHPFWVIEEKEEWNELENGELVSSSSFTQIGWLPAEELIRYKHHVLLTDALAMVSGVFPVFTTKEDGVGFIPAIDDPDRYDYGSLVDFNCGRKFIPGSYDPTEDDWDDHDPYLKVRVYNFEVEDFHTYFVDCGAWVHNTNCES